MSAAKLAAYILSWIPAFADMTMVYVIPAKAGIQDYEIEDFIEYS